jgi:hypothetical protein
MRRSLILAGTLFLSAAAAPASAQQSDEQAVRAVVDRLFDGMRSRDTTMMRSTFADEAQFYGIGPDGGVQVTTPSAFIANIAAAPAGLLLDEVLHDVEIRVDGPLATVWTYYDLFVGGEFQHCGYDAMQLLRIRDEWRIVALADTRREEGCRPR